MSNWLRWALATSVGLFSWIASTPRAMAQADGKATPARAEAKAKSDAAAKVVPKKAAKKPKRRPPVEAEGDSSATKRDDTGTINAGGILLTNSFGVGRDYFKPRRGRFTFDAEGTEGGPFHSRRPTVPGDASGVTVGRGYDEKTKSYQKVYGDLISAGVPAEAAEDYADAAGLEGDEARDYLAEAKLPELTPEQQYRLFERSYSEADDEVRRISAKKGVVKQYGPVDWAKTDPAIRDMLVDLRYRGDYSPATRGKIQEAASDNDLEAFTKALSDEDLWAKVPDDRFNRRVDYLEEALKRRQQAKAAEKARTQAPADARP